MVIKKKETIYHLIFKYLNTFSTIFLVTTFFGVYLINESYVDIVNSVYHLFIAIFLIIRFNPWVHYKSNPAEDSFNQNIAFSAGIYLIISSVFLTFIRYYAGKVQKTVQKRGMEYLTRVEGPQPTVSKFEMKEKGKGDGR